VYRNWLYQVPSLEKRLLHQTSIPKLPYMHVRSVSMVHRGVVVGWPGAPIG
jgi:hypothetical protein